MSKVGSRCSTAAAALGLLAATPLAAEPFTFVALGDMPYTLPDDYPRYERLIAAVNKEKPAFTLHIGDTKGGSVLCSDEVLGKTRAYFDSFEQPVIYTPGDNEWTDCHRERAGKFDPLERLAKVRELHFDRAESLGSAPLPLERQSDLMPAHAQMVENARWTRDGVVFATVHVVGSNNGFERTIASIEEYMARDAANTAWIEDTFGKATESGAPAVVIGFQANPYWDRTPADRGGNDGFVNTLKALAAGAEAFKKPVLLVQGDDHILIIDQPLLDSTGKKPLANVTRLQVMGADLVHAVKVLVDPDSAGVFGFVPLVVKENLELAAN